MQVVTAPPSLWVSHSTLQTTGEESPRRAKRGRSDRFRPGLIASQNLSGLLLLAPQQSHELVHTDIGVTENRTQSADRERSSLVNRHGDPSSIGCSTHMQMATPLSLLLKPRVSTPEPVADSPRVEAWDSCGHWHR